MSSKKRISLHIHNLAVPVDPQVFVHWFSRHCAILRRNVICSILWDNYSQNTSCRISKFIFSKFKSTLLSIVFSLNFFCRPLAFLKIFVNVLRFYEFVYHLWDGLYFDSVGNFSFLSKIIFYSLIITIF